MMMFTTTTAQVLLSTMALMATIVSADRLFHAIEETVCGGVDFSTCTQDDLDFFARCVEDTYNSINGPDLYLYDTKWVGLLRKEGGRQLQAG